jgi:hypothetical protein
LKKSVDKWVDLWYNYYSKKGKEMVQMFKVVMIVDDCEYVYGTYADRNRANEIAMQVRCERQVETYVCEA